jgi:hypothetical protein
MAILAELIMMSLGWVRSGGQLWSDHLLRLTVYGDPDGEERLSVDERMSGGRMKKREGEYCTAKKPGCLR